MKKKSLGWRLLGMFTIALMMTVGLLSADRVAAFMNVFTPFAAADDTITVYMSFEGYNLGQGFYIEPTALTLPENSTAEDATRLLLATKGHNFIAFGSGTSFYLSRVSDFDTGVVNPPPFITEPLTSGSGDGSLGEFDYSFASGWMITANHQMLSMGAGAYLLEGGEVLRWQFTVQGFGADLGLSGFASEPLYTHADKTELIRGLFLYEATDHLRQAALDVIINPLATAQEVADALAALRNGSSEVGTNPSAPIAGWVEIHHPNGNFLARLNEFLTNHGQVAPEFDYSVVRRIRVTGNMNNNDFLQIRDHLSHVEEIDLENADNFLGTFPANGLSGMQKLRVVTLPNRNPAGANAGLNALQMSSLLQNNPNLETVVFPGFLRGTFTANIFLNTPSLTTIIFGFETAPTLPANLFDNHHPRPIAYVPNRNVGGYENENFTRHFLEVRSLNEPSEPEDVDDSETTFIVVTRGATVGIYQKGLRHFAAFTSFPLIRDEARSDEQFDVYMVSDLPLNRELHLEVSKPGYVKQARFLNLSATGATISVQLTPLTSWTPVDNGFMNANMYTNLDDTGTLNLQVGDTFNLDTFRVWQAMAGMTLNYFIEPDYTFELIGDSAQIQRVGGTGREQLAITAVSPGVSVINITYGPLAYVQANGSTLYFNGIDPRNTISVVVNVGGGANFDTGITMRNDFDTVYFDQTAGFRDFTFTPAAGSTVRVHAPLHAAEWGSGWQEGSAATDGSFTVPLRDGRNIIEIRNGSAVRYHVVKARGINVTLTNITNPGAPFAVGDVARIALRGMSEPVEKLAGLYNPGVPGMFGTPDLRPFIRYTNGEVNVNSSRGIQYRTLTDTFTVEYTLTDPQLNVLNGQLHSGFMGSPMGTHRNIPLSGVAANLNAIAHGPFPFGMLPEIVLPVVETTIPEPPGTSIDISRELRDTLDRLVQLTPEPEFNIIGGEWTITALARGRHPVPNGYFAGYYRRIVERLNEQDGVLSENRFTDYARLAVALNALGKDARDVEGHDIIARLMDYDNVVRQGINGPIWALIALSSKDFAGTEAIKASYIEFILEREISTGGFALAGQNADPDITGMALYALATHRDNPDVGAAVERAVAALANIQRPDGGFHSWGTSNSQSSAQVIIGLTALGIDPVTDSRFVVNGNNPLTALLSFYVSGGGFRHVATGDLEGMATEQGALALVAYDRFLSGQHPLFNMRDVDLNLENTIPAPDLREASLIMQAPDFVRGAKDTNFKAIVRTSAFPEGDFRLLEGIIDIPAELIVDDLTIPNTLVGGSLIWHYDEADHVVRFVYTNTALTNIELRATTFPAELLMLALRVADDMDPDVVADTTIRVQSASLKETSTTQIFAFDVSEATSTIAFHEHTGEDDDHDEEEDEDDGIGGPGTTIPEITTLSIRELFRGDGVDLIPADMRAIAIAVDHIPEGMKLLYRGTPLFFSSEMTEKHGVPTYILMIDVAASTADLMNPENYEVVIDELSETIIFGDTTGNGIVNAQDALNVITGWLRKTEVVTPRAILAKNVNADARIDTLDALAIMENFISHIEFVIIGK